VNLIGLGARGCKLVEHFRQYNEYKIYKIDFDLVGLKKDGIFCFPEVTTVEECESKFPSMSNFFKNATGRTILFTSGADILCASALRVLETIKVRNTITVVYIKPDTILSDPATKLIDNAAFNVFQQYARSGAFENLYLISEEKLFDAVGDVAIANFESSASGLVASVFHIINVMNNSQPIYDNYSKRVDIARISTIGMSSIEENMENLLFPLDFCSEKSYYYLIPKKILDTDQKLMQKILTQVKNNIKKDKIKIGFGVYETEYEEPYVYVTCSSSIIQGIEL